MTVYGTLLVGGTGFLTETTPTYPDAGRYWDMTQVAVQCSVWQCVAMCCNVVQWVAVGCSGLQWVAVGCSGLQFVAVGCSVLQCVAG